MTKRRCETAGGATPGRDGQAVRSRSRPPASETNSTRHAKSPDRRMGRCHVGEERRPTSSEDKEALRQWAREWARRLPPWSDEQWRQINAGLGYRVTPRQPQSAVADGKSPVE